MLQNKSWYIKSMAFKYGDLLKFKNDIDYSIIVSGIMPKGQMGMTEDHIKIKIDSQEFNISQRISENLFEKDYVEPSSIEKKKKEEIKKIIEKIETEIKNEQKDTSKKVKWIKKVVKKKKVKRGEK